MRHHFTRDESKVAAFPTRRRRASDSPVAPAVGRLVHYGQTPMAALIVGTSPGPGDRVHLKVWGTDGLSEFSARNVPYSPTPAPQSWTWMPTPELEDHP